MLMFYFFAIFSVFWGSQKWPKSLHSEWKFFLKNSYFSKIVETVFIYKNITSSQKLHQNWTIFGEVSCKKHYQNKAPWMPIWYAKLWKFVTWQPQRLYWWNVPRIYISVKSFTWQILGAEFKGHQRMHIWNVFWLMSIIFQTKLKNSEMHNAFACI